MARTTKTDEQLLERRKRTAELYLQCLSMAEIGRQLGVSCVTVYKDICWAREQWRTQATDAIEKHKQIELGRIDHLEVEAWRGWVRSVGLVKIYKSESGTGAHGPIDKESVTKERKAGDPRFLDIVAKCIESRRKIIGLDAPTSIDLGLSRDVVSVLSTRIEQLDKQPTIQ